MRLIITLFASSVLALISCDTIDKSSAFLKIKVDNRFLTISESESKLSLDSFINGKSITLQQKINLSQEEKMRLMKLAKKASRIETYTINTLTCFAGQDFKIQYMDIEDTLYIEESSVKQWTTIAPEFLKIQQIINERCYFPE